jgi:hypothetical protein
LRRQAVAGNIRTVGTKADWSRSFGPIERVRLTPGAIEVIDRAGLLSRAEVVRLDVAEGQNAVSRMIAWDLLRDQLDGAGLQAERFTARNDAWEAVARSLLSLALEPTPDDGYWRVAARVGSGAARAARYAACASIAPERVDPETTAMLLAPWQTLAAADPARTTLAPGRETRA